MSEESITSRKHNEYVGTDANAGRIPGASDATTGHHYIAIFPKEGAPKAGSHEKRAQEHLPPPTGRDRPPFGGQPTKASETEADGNIFIEHLTSDHRPPSPPLLHQQPKPLSPAPDSITVVDTDPFATPPLASETLTGATSKDLYRGIGKPPGGTTSQEVHYGGKAHRKILSQGPDQYGTTDEIFGKGK